MKRSKAKLYRLSIVAVAFLSLIGMRVRMTGEPASKHRAGKPTPQKRHLGLVEDWSTHHLVFSNPGTYEQAAKTGASYAKWLTIRYDTRFILQQAKRYSEATGGVLREMSTGGEEAVSPLGLEEPEDLSLSLLRQFPGEPITKPKPVPKPKPAPVKRDWNAGLYGGMVQPNAYPAKYGASLTSASCSDFVVFPTGTGGSSSAATIVAYNNLYKGCTGSVPSVFWAYNTAGSALGYSASTSPIISEDGSQVAFMKYNGESPDHYATLDLLKWGPSPVGTLTSPGCPYPCTTNLTFTTDGTIYRTTTGPIYMAMSFSNLDTDTFSQPFYDYGNDVLYVGDDSGYLHMFTGVFNGAPAEATSPWPVQLSTNKLASPVYDPVSGNVFVGDMGGYLYAVGSGNMGTTAGSKTASAQLGDVIIDAPLVDPSAEMVYVFVTTSGGNNTVYQFPATFSSQSTGSGSAVVGTGGTGYYLYSGDFDNVYYLSSNATGNLYVVGNTGGTTGAKLYQIPILSNVIQGAKALFTGLTGSGVPPWPSPLTEFCNNGTNACVSNGTSTTSGADYLFFSVNMGNETGCGGDNGCVLSYNITTPSSPAFSAGLGVPNVVSPGCWATGGIVIDNSDPTTMLGASQVYFINLYGNTAGGAGGATSGQCATGSRNIIQAVQASQAALN
jgi:hypothetical protein